MGFIFPTCSDCICEACMYHHSYPSRCPYSKCYDDYRAENDPYDEAHPNAPPRTTWSHWEADQAYWCRGGAFHPAKQCAYFVQFKGKRVKQCLRALVEVHQDGYILCSLVDSIGCEKCYELWKQKENNHDKNLWGQ